MSRAFLLALFTLALIARAQTGRSCSASAQVLFRQQQLAAAQAQLESCLRADPHDAASTELLGLVLASGNDNSRAGAYLREALESAPDNREYRVNLAVFLARNEEIDKADQVIQPLLASSQDPNVDRLIGYIRLRQHQEREAISWFEKALQQSPDSVETLYRLAFAHHSLGDLAEAIDVYHRVLKIDPNHFFARLQLGKVLLLEGSYNEADQELTQATLIRPSYPSTWRYLSEAQLFTGKPQAALKSARTAVERGADDPRNYYQLGAVLTRLGETRAAEEQLQTMEKVRAARRSTPPDPLEY